MDLLIRDLQRLKPEDRADGKTIIVYVPSPESIEIEKELPEYIVSQDRSASIAGSRINPSGSIPWGVFLKVFEWFALLIISALFHSFMLALVIELFKASNLVAYQPVPLLF